MLATYPKPEYVDPVAKLVKFKIQKLGFDLAWAAHKIDFGYEHLRRFLNGSVRWTSLKTRLRAAVANFLHIRAEELDLLNDCFHPGNAPKGAVLKNGI